MGLVNTVVPYEKLEEETLQWCEEIFEKSPTALRFLKASFNADTDGLAGLQQLVETLHFFTIQQMKLKKAATPLKKKKTKFQEISRVFLKNSKRKNSLHRTLHDDS